MKQPNIIFLLVDQMQKRAADPASPCIMENLTRLRRDAVTFDNTHTVNAICSPARASLLTGVLPHRHGMVDCTHTVPDYRAEFDASLDTLPQRLQRAGYHTCYYGKWHVERSYQLENFGVEDYETEKQIPKRKLTPVSKITVSTPGYKDNTICGVYAEGLEASEEYYIYSKGIDFIEGCRKQGKPFCAFLSTYAPHDPYTVPKEIYDLYADRPIELPANFDDPCLDKPNIYRRLQSVWKDLSREDAKNILRSYYSYCTLVDTQIGRLVQYLKTAGLYEDTMIVFLSDHGDMAGAHGLFCKGVPAFEEGYAIPLVIKFPDEQLGGTCCSAPATICDVMPTVLDCAGLSAEGCLDGRSLIPVANGSDDGKRCTMAEFFGQRYSYTQRIVWWENWKYVFNTFDFDELYDLNSDPFELNNLANLPQYQDRKQEMAARMWDQLKATEDQYMCDAQYYMHRFAPVGPSRFELSADTNMYNNLF